MSDFYEPLDGPVLNDLAKLGRFVRRDAETVLERHYPARASWPRSKTIKETNRWLKARCAEGRMLQVGTIAVGPRGFRGWVYVAVTTPIPNNPRFRYLQPASIDKQ